MIIVWMLVIATWVTFSMDPVEQFSDRFNISLTLVLASVAFLYVAGESLPRVSYLTILDKILLLCFFFQFLVAGQSFLVFLVGKSSKPTAAVIDAISFWAIPILFVALK